MFDAMSKCETKISSRESMVGQVMDGVIAQAFESIRIVEENVCIGGARLAHSISDFPVCCCEIDEKTEYACGEGCINRSMRYECVVEYCPCGERCSNRQLQIGSTVTTAVVDCERKGVGLIALERVNSGQFVGEYVGEVLNISEAKLRSQLYRNSEHIYMLQVNANMVIDATRFGGRMRFMNHSCEPNCRMEKWNVRGQERCGLFTICQVDPGKEFTFDYGFQYFDSGHVMECFCGSPSCRGVIGVRKRNQPVEQQACVEPPTKKRMVQLTIDRFLFKER